MWASHVRPKFYTTAIRRIHALFSLFDADANFNEINTLTHLCNALKQAALSLKLFFGRRNASSVKLPKKHTY